MSRIIVTGGLGHIGSGLIRHLLARDYKVICIDNLLTQRVSSLRGLVGNRSFQFIDLDIAAKNLLLSKVLDGRKIDCIVHLAAITNAEASHDKAEEVHNNNYNSTKNIVNFCQESNIKLIFPSSTSVYGSADAEVFEDDPSVLKPQSPYAESKVNEEELIINSLGKNFNILRLGTIFGASPGMRFHTAVNKFCWQASLGQPISVWKTAMNQYRPYLALSDAFRAIDFFIENNHEGAVFNVLTQNYTVHDILEAIKEFSEIEIEFVESKIMNQLSYFVSNDKITSLGFDFQGNLQEAIKETMDWLQLES
jgi:nucleoside-diphosphate-sugar epimerase